MWRKAGRLPALAGVLLPTDLASQNGAIENAPAFSGDDLTALPTVYPIPFHYENPAAE